MMEKLINGPDSKGCIMKVAPAKGISSTRKREKKEKDCSLPSKEEADAARSEKIRSVRNPQILIFLRKESFYVLFFYLGLFFEMSHEPLSIEEGTLTKADSSYLVLDRRTEVRQTP